MNTRSKLRLWKSLAGLAFLGWLAAWSFFAWVAPSRARPDPALDRVHPWPNHGAAAYLSGAEDLALKVVGGGSLLLLWGSIGAGAALERRRGREEPWTRS